MMSREGQIELGSPKNTAVDETRNEEEEDLSLQLRQKVWQGKLAAKISLAASESKSFTNSPPLYVPAALNPANVAPTPANSLPALFSGANHNLL